MSKFGEVVGKLEGAAQEEAQALREGISALEMQIEILSRKVRVNSRRLWDAIEEHVPLDRKGRAYSYKPATGEVLDQGPIYKGWAWEGTPEKDDEQGSLPPVRK